VKTYLKILTLLATLILTSCGSSIQSDAQKVADLQCEAKEIMLKAMSGDQDAVKESQELSNKANELNLKMLKKYSSPEDKQAFSRALLDANGNCY